MTAALCDLVRALSGEQLERLPMLPSPENALGVVSKVPTVKDQTEHAVAKGNDRTSFAQSYVEPFAVQSLRLDAALTSRLRQRARTEETTLHGALCSAVIHAGRMTSSDWRQETLRLLSPINARKQCGIGNTSSMCIGAAIIPIAHGLEPDIWSLAGRINPENSGTASLNGLDIVRQRICV